MLREAGNQLPPGRLVEAACCLSGRSARALPLTISVAPAAYYCSFPGECYSCQEFQHFFTAFHGGVVKMLKVFFPSEQQHGHVTLETHALRGYRF